MVLQCGWYYNFWNLGSKNGYFRLTALTGKCLMEALLKYCYPLCSNVTFSTLLLNKMWLFRVSYFHTLQCGRASRIALHLFCCNIDVAKSMNHYLAKNMGSSLGSLHLVFIAVSPFSFFRSGHCLYHQ